MKSVDFKLTFAFCGPENSGKSSLAGYCKLEGQNDERLIEKRKRIALNELQCDKKYLEDTAHSLVFRYKEEKERQTTTRFKSLVYSKKLKWMNTPSPNVSTKQFCQGVALADYHIVVFPVNANEKHIAQTVEILRILAACGAGKISPLIFAVSKMDVVQYSETAFQSTKRTIYNLVSRVFAGVFRSGTCSRESKHRMFVLFMCLKRIGLPLPRDLRIIIGKFLLAPKIIAVPVCRSQNLSKPSESMPWQKQTLFNACSKMKCPVFGSPNDPSRILVFGWMKIIGLGTIVLGKVLSGTVRPGDEIVIRLQHHGG